MENSKVTQEKKVVESEEVRMSKKHDTKFYMLISKVVLKKFGKLILSTLGATCEMAIKVAERLEREGYATMDKISSDLVEFEGENDRNRKTTKFTVNMTKSLKFDELVKDKIK